MMNTYYADRKTIGLPVQLRDSEGEHSFMENKLDFLMTLTGTRNSVLSKAISFDPSYISRIRRGRRSIPLTPQFVTAVAGYFGRNIKDPGQLDALREVLCPGEELPDSKEALEELLAEWLGDKNRTAPDYVQNFLTGFYRASSSAGSKADAKAASAVSGQDAGAGSGPLPTASSMGKPSSEAWFFYGNEGKRNAVEAFLARLCRTGKTYSLLLYSDEEMSWLYEDPVFAREWAAMLFHLLNTGSRIRIPHNITRNSNEMFEAVSKWIPLYMTGAIEPYYYPRLRDGVYHRSLFLAAGDSALISDSVGNATEGMLNILITDKAAVKALEQEYAEYISLCRPLMQIYNAHNQRAFFTDYSRFERLPADLIIAQPLPSFFTMPQPAVRKVQAASANSSLGELHSRSYSAFREQMRAGRRVTEILHLPDPALIRSGAVRIPVSDFHNAPGLFVSAGLLVQHLKNTIRLLKREPWYQVILSAKVPPEIMLHVKERSGAQLISAFPPTTVFGIDETNMVSAFWEYLYRIAEESARPREEVIRKLTDYIAELEN